jgi:branched-chain amino acid transport system substrate-binding protein
MMTTTCRLLLALLLAAAAGCTGGANPPPVTLGHVANLSAPEGAHAEKGIRLALEELTAAGLAGELHGRALVVRHADTRGLPDAADAQAVRLAGVNRAAGLIGGATPDALKHLARAPVPDETPHGAQVDGVSDRINYVGFTATAQGHALAKLAAEALGVDRVLVAVDRRRDTAPAVADAFTTAFARHKPKAPPPTLVRFDKDVDWLAFAKHFDAARPQALVFVGTGDDLRAFRAKHTGPAMCLFAGDDGDVPAFEPDRPPIHFATAFAPDPDAPAAQAFVKKYEAAFKEAPDVAAALGYESLLLYATALKQITPPLSVDKIRDELAGLKDVPGLLGPLTVTADHQVRRTVVTARQDAKGVNVVQRYTPE